MQVRSAGRHLLQLAYLHLKALSCFNIFLLRRLLQLACRYRKTLWSVCILTMPTFLCQFVYLYLKTRSLVNAHLLEDAVSSAITR